MLFCCLYLQQLALWLETFVYLSVASTSSWSSCCYSELVPTPKVAILSGPPMFHIHTDWCHKPTNQPTEWVFSTIWSTGVQPIHNHTESLHLTHDRGGTWGYLYNIIGDTRWITLSKHHTHVLGWIKETVTVSVSVQVRTMYRGEKEKGDDPFKMQHKNRWCHNLSCSHDVRAVALSRA